MNNNNVNIEITNMKKLFSPLLRKLEYKEKDNEYVDEEKKKSNKFISRVVENKFISTNEIKINDIIREIPYYQHRYNILYNYKPLALGEFDRKLVYNNSNKSKDIDYFLFQFKNEKFITFNENLFLLKTPKSLIFFVTETFTFLLTSLIELRSHNICFFDLSHKNIVLPFECREKPVLTHFQNSLLLLGDINNELTISKIIENINDYTYKPLEIFVLFYLFKNNLNTISYATIEEISEFYTKSLTVLKLFSLEYQNNFKLLCIKSLKRYINKHKKDIVCEILRHSYTWENYSLCLLYLHIVGNMLRVFSCKNTFISVFVGILAKNISPEPSDREKLEITLEKYGNLYYKFSDWSFVNKISQEKMCSLLKILSE